MSVPMECSYKFTVSEYLSKIPLHKIKFSSWNKQWNGLHAIFNENCTQSMNILRRKIIGTAQISWLLDSMRCLLVLRMTHFIAFTKQHKQNSRSIHLGPKKWNHEPYLFEKLMDKSPVSKWFLHVKLFTAASHTLICIFESQTKDAMHTQMLMQR